MKIIFIVFITCLCNGAYTQSLAEKAFAYCVQEGYSTAPNFVVINTNSIDYEKIEPRIVDVFSLYQALKLELKITDYDLIEKFLLETKFEGSIDFTNPLAFERLPQIKSNPTKFRKIRRLFRRKNLLKGFRQLLTKESQLDNLFYRYLDKRVEWEVEILQELDVPNSEQREMLENLGSDLYYDYAYNSHKTPKSAEGLQVLRLWNEKNKKYSALYKSIETQIENLKNTNYRNYILKYGFDFCLIAFEYGVIFYQDEVAATEFDLLIE